MNCSIQDKANLADFISNRPLDIADYILVLYQSKEKRINEYK